MEFWTIDFFSPPTLGVAAEGSFHLGVIHKGRPHSRGRGGMAYADAGGRGEGGSLPLQTSYFKPSFKPKIFFFKKSFHVLKTIIPFPWN